MNLSTVNSDYIVPFTIAHAYIILKIMVMQERKINDAFY
jgi:hypothetical protein